MDRRQVLRAGAMVALAGAAVGGCSDDGETASPSTTTTTAVTAEAFAEEVVERCLARSATVDETEPDSDAFAADASEEVRRSNAEWVRTFATEFEALADDIAEIEAPDDTGEAVDEMDATLRSFSEEMTALADKVEAGGVTEADAGRAFEQLAAADAAAAQLEVPGGLSTCGQEPDEVDPDAAVVEVTAVEHEFRIDPATIAPGPTAFVLGNEGEEIHELILLRALQPEGIVLALGAEGTGADSSQFAVQVGETSAGPGLTGVLNVDDLAPGDYGLVCFVPGPDGVPHATKGMVEVFTVA